MQIASGPSGSRSCLERKTYHSAADALAAVTSLDHEYVFVRHRLSAGEAIDEHHHPVATEMVIFDQGTAEINFQGRSEVMDFTKAGAATVLTFPPGCRHALKALSDLEYVVVRDQNDEIVYAGSPRSVV
jgi:quercetin dioxygenase-like cupin family protein